MTFLAQETSVEAGRPVELYYFQIGSTGYRYTSAEDEMSFGGNTYYPRSIQRTNPEQGTDERRQEIEITLPSNDDVAARYIGIVPGEQTTLTITRYHRGDAEAYILWSGKIVGAAYKQQGAYCTLRGMTTEAAFSRLVPRLKFQGLCNHVLYDSQCALARSSYKYSGTCSTISGNTVTVAGVGAAHGAGWAVGGYISFGDLDYRLVIAQSGDILTLRIPFENDPTGETLDVYAGCDHTLTTCNSKFSNAANYGGFPFVPTINPFESGLV